MHPLLTLPLHAALKAAAKSGQKQIEASIDLGRSTSALIVGPESWSVGQRSYPYAARCKERTVYHWDGENFEPVSRFGEGGLIKLVPTDWGPPTFEIDGIKMLPTAQLSPFEDARHKVGLIEPEGKSILDTCAGLGYFAHWCVARAARRVVSYEKNPDVLWLRTLNPWSPASDARGLELSQGDVASRISEHPAETFDAILHDPPRFGIAGALYSQAFYDELARVLKPRGLLFHYTGSPNKLTSGRDLPQEVSLRLQRAGFTTAPHGDGVLARRVARR